MDLQAQSSESRFSAYVEGLVSVIRHADRARPLRDYCTGLILPLARKSVEPMAAVTALPKIERHGPIEAWIIDDTAFPKKGRHSVGVAWQYCGQLGKRDNCQVAVSLLLANTQASLPAAWRLYLPQNWAWDADRRKKAGMPEEIGFATKLPIALE